MSWLFGWLVPGESDSDYDYDDDTDIDSQLLYEVGKGWVQTASQSDNEAAPAMQQAVEHIETQSRGGFLHWLKERW